MWRAFTKDGQHLFEGKHGRPIEAGNNGELVAICEEENHHQILVDLIHGVIIIGYDGVEISEETKTLQVNGPKLFIWIADETNIVGDLKEVVRKEVTPPPEEEFKEGWYSETEYPLIWRPIWFTRHVIGAVTTQVRVIGAQTTLPEMYGGHNVKKMVMLYDDGRIGIS